jgi:ATP-dependent Clp protease ATP-binding subunit ClpC
MTPATSEPDLLQIRRLAEELAHSRKETSTTGHLLAAIASLPSQASELLRERQLGPETLLKAARATTDREPDPLARSVQRGREIASRTGATMPTALHLLLALIHDQDSGAHRALSQCGVNVGRLRAAAMQLVLGRIGPRRNLGAGFSGGSTPSQRAGEVSAQRTATGVAIPMIPSPRPAVRTEASPGGQRQAAPLFPAVPATPVPLPAPAAPKPRPVPARPGAGSAHRKRQARTPTSRFELDPKLFPTVSALGKNLTLAASQGELDPVIGRSTEIDRTLDVLAKRHANNPLLVGRPGVGKTSVVRGVALRIVALENIASLDDRVIVEIPVSELLAGTGSRGSLAERIAALRNEVREAMGRVVLFFDEIHTLFAGDVADEAVAELKLALARGEIPCIGSTTAEDYRRVIEADGALARRFTLVEIDEPSPEDALLVLEGSAPALGRHHGVEYSDEALKSSITWSVRYLPGRPLPDKALSILDLAGARAHRRSNHSVAPEAVAEVIAELASVPVDRLMEKDCDRMLRLEALLGDRVVGHGPLLARMATILRRNAAGLRGRRPIGTFLLLGPTGVGKTESAKAIAQALFHSPDAMTRLDMAEYSEPHAVARLIGAPPGYVGHDAGGQLTEAVRRRPYQVVLLDEIEKAHREVLETFMAVFDEGRLTDGRGRTVDFTNTVIILTSNLGARDAMARSGRAIGFGAGSADRSRQIEDVLVAAARAELPPELYNRIDEVLAFLPLERADVAEIARRLLAGIGVELYAARKVHLDVEDESVQVLLDAGGFDPELGARPMKRTLARLVEAPIAELILRGELGAGDVARLATEDGKIVVDVVKRDAAAATPLPRTAARAATP